MPQDPPAASGSAPAIDGPASLLALAVDLGNIAIWRQDLATNRLHCNEQACRVLGIPARPEGLTLEEVRAFVHPDDLAQELVSAQAALAGEQPVDMEARYRRSDGSWRHVMTRRVVERDRQGRALAFVGVALDLTERRQIELALRSANERAALAARGTGLGTWELDLRTGEAIWDEQMWILRGRAPQPSAMAEAERFACVHPEDLDSVKRFLHEPATAGATVDQEFRVLWPDGSVHWLASRSLELRDELSGEVRRIGVNWDVTDRRMAEVARQERELSQSRDLAKSKFLSRMSHELRTPLNAVLGFSQLLLAEEHGSDAASHTRRRRLEQIRSAGQHLLTLINDVLDLSRLEGGEMSISLQAVPLRELVTEALPMLSPQCERLGVTLRSGTLDASAMADPTRLRQVLLNLLSNAIKYNRPGGSVVVEGLCQGSEVLIRVSDTGQGLSAQQLEHLFEPFNRLGRENDSSEGTGIGLAIVKALVERMGGSVHVESHAGQGSVFEVRLAAAVATGVEASAPLPTGRDARPTLPVNGSRTPSPSAPRHRLLYIEDNPINAMIIGELVARRSDLRLDVAVDGASGVAQAAALRPDLILLDMQLPDIDGFEVLRRLRQASTTAAIPCIALSANAMPEDIQRALQAGMSDYWTKPLDFKAFMASIEALFGPAP
jgi:hypothetical protein